MIFVGIASVVIEVEDAGIGDDFGWEDGGVVPVFDGEDGGASDPDGSGVTCFEVEEVECWVHLENILFHYGRRVALTGKSLGQSGRQ